MANIKYEDEKKINYNIEHCKYDIRKLNENVQNLYLDKLFEIKKDKYIDDKTVNCLIVYYLEIRPQDSDTKWLIEIEKNYSHLKPYERALKLEQLQAPELEMKRQARIEAKKVKIPDYVEDYDYIDYDSKTISVFEEEIYEEEETRIRNIDKDHNHGHFNPDYAEYPYSKKTSFDVKKFSDTILHFIGEKINNNNIKSYDKFIVIKKSDFPVKFISLEHQFNKYNIELTMVHYEMTKKSGIIIVSLDNGSGRGNLKLDIKNNSLVGAIILKNNEKIRLNFKKNEGYIYTYNSNDPVVYTID